MKNVRTKLQGKRRLMVPVNSKMSLILSVVMMTIGIAIIYYASHGFSGTAGFQGSVGPIVPNNLTPFFAAGVVIFALGIIQVLSSVSAS